MSVPRVDRARSVSATSGMEPDSVKVRRFWPRCRMVVTQSETGRARKMFPRPRFSVDMVPPGGMLVGEVMR